MLQTVFLKVWGREIHSGIYSNTTWGLNYGEPVSGGVCWWSGISRQLLDWQCCTVGITLAVSDKYI